eukprot:scaffold97550_cov17-Tisochrysis_lutea.AAC.1
MHANSQIGQSSSEAEYTRMHPDLACFALSLLFTVASRSKKRSSSRNKPLPITLEDLQVNALPFAQRLRLYKRPEYQWSVPFPVTSRFLPYPRSFRCTHCPWPRH